MSITSDQAGLLIAAVLGAAATQDPIVHTVVGSVSGALAASIVMVGTWQARVSCGTVSMLTGFSLTATLIAYFAPQSPAHAYMAVAFGLAFAAWGVLKVLQEGAPSVGRMILDGLKRFLGRLFGAPK